SIELARKRSLLYDAKASEFRYREEIINPLVVSIFIDIEYCIWFSRIIVDVNTSN
ncbi:7116_t:CDS:1, partial [Entrophospora sp. SA101]